MADAYGMLQSYKGKASIGVELTVEERAFLAKHGYLHSPYLVLRYEFDGAIYDRRYEAIDDPPR